MEKAAFGAGCFWHVQAEFDRIPGVKRTLAGYMGGGMKSPTYKDVCTGRTGHAEVVQVEFDPKKVSYGSLLKAFWKMHDPTQFNRQGPDVGKQYRSVIFYHSDRQKREAGKSLKEYQKKLKKKIATQVVPAKEFWPAEEYHQRYFRKHRVAACATNIIGKVFK
ncbi:MAG: peptide-methionine (S)-S-oxide reductase MsrA [Candidatus Aenigmarchaeota archaeon]|nr:peptide-methionine (S)-S-oxide reductase MsrA [Candidatus Aenigmarchaeota archaeon]